MKRLVSCFSFALLVACAAPPTSVEEMRDADLARILVQTHADFAVFSSRLSLDRYPSQWVENSPQGFPAYRYRLAKGKVLIVEVEDAVRKVTRAYFAD